MDARKWGVQQLADALGVSYQAVAKVRDGGAFGVKNNMKAASLFKLNPTWLATGQGPKHISEDASKTWDANVTEAPASAARRLYPVISTVQAGEWSETIDTFHPGDAEDWTESPKDLGPHGFILRVKGDSMTNPEGGKENFPNGISVHIRPEVDAQPGEFVVAKRVAENEATFKKLVRVDGDLYLHAINPSWPKPYIKLEPGDKIIGKLKFAGWDY